MVGVLIVAAVLAVAFVVACSIFIRDERAHRSKAVQGGRMDNGDYPWGSVPAVRVNSDLNFSSD